MPHTNEKKAIEALRIEVRENHIAEDLAVLFSESKRTESVVDLRKMHSKLVSQGTNMDDILWLRAVKALETHDIGVLEYDTHRRPLRLVGVRVTMKSLGDAIFGKRETLETPRFGQGAGRKAVVSSDRVVPKATPTRDKLQRSAPPASPQRRATDGMVAIPPQRGNGKLIMGSNGSVTIELPENLSMDDLAKLMSKFRNQ